MDLPKIKRYLMVLDHLSADPTFGHDARVTLNELLFSEINVSDYLDSIDHHPYTPFECYLRAKVWHGSAAFIEGKHPGSSVTKAV